MFAVDDFSDIENENVVPRVFCGSLQDANRMDLMMRMDYWGLCDPEKLSIDESILMMDSYEGKKVLARHSPHIDVLMDMMGLRGEDTIMSKNVLMDMIGFRIEDIIMNKHVPKDTIMKFLDEGGRTPSTYHLHADEEVSRRQLNVFLTPTGRVAVEDMRYLSTMDIALNPYLPQDVYSRTLDECIAHNNVEPIIKMFNNPGVGEEVLRKMVDIDYLKLCDAPPHVPQDVLDSIGNFKGCGIEVAKKLMSHHNRGYMVLNPHITNEMRWEIVNSIIGGDVMYSSLEEVVSAVSMYSNDTDMFVKVSQAMGIFNNHFYVRTRDEPEVMLSNIDNAIWAMQHSPDRDIVRECMRKHPDMAGLVDHNVFFPYGL